MTSDWILDVLADLKQFAKTNGLPTLAEQLDDTAIVALSDIASKLENAAANNESEIIGKH